MTLRAWISASRPTTLIAGAVPVAVGTACAYAAGGMRWIVALAALFGALAIQIGTNFVNDFADAEKGADGPDRLGPTRAVAAGLLSARAMRSASVAAFAIAAAIGIYLVWIAGWPIAAIGAASIASGIAYTAGPAPLGYKGLGDAFVMIFFGLVATCGTAYAQLGRVPIEAWPCAVAVGSLITSILVVNNARDRETDAKVGKRTLAVRFGKRGALIEQAILYLLAYAAPLALVPTRGFAALLPLVSAPAAIWLWLDLRAGEGRRLNATLAGTARLAAVHGALMCLGIALGGPSAPG